MKLQRILFGGSLKSPLRDPLQGPLGGGSFYGSNIYLIFIQYDDCNFVKVS